jgi:hypothetical protein
MLGLFGSIIGTILLSTKKMEKRPAWRIYRFLLIIDAIYLASQVAEYSMDHFNFRLRFISDTICKFYLYFKFSVCPISPWILVYISFDRYISICFKRFQILRKKRFQNLMIFLIISYSLCFYSPFLMSVELTISQLNNSETNGTSISISCDILREDLHYIYLIFLMHHWFHLSWCLWLLSFFYIQYSKAD